MRNGRTPTNILTLLTLFAIATVAAFWSAAVAQAAVTCKPGFELARTKGGEARCTPAAGPRIAPAARPTATAPAAPPTATAPAAPPTAAAPAAPPTAAAPAAPPAATAPAAPPAATAPAAPPTATAPAAPEEQIRSILRNW